VELLNLDLEFAAAGVPNYKTNEDESMRTCVSERCVVAERVTAQGIFNGPASLQTTNSVERCCPTYVLQLIFQHVLQWLMV
jgi:hypothetical protein